METRKRNTKETSIEKLKKTNVKKETVESEPLLPVSPGVQKGILLVGLCLFWTCLLIGFMKFFYFDEEKPIVIANSYHQLDRLLMPLECSKDYGEDKFSGCTPTSCGRFVTDSVVTEEEARGLKHIVKEALSLGGSNGGASILDLHSGALSKGDAFVDVFQIMKQTNKRLIREEDFDLYVRVKNKVHQAVAAAFNVIPEKLYLTKPTFFSRMSTKVAKTVHDEYWHPHVDKQTYGSFHYTALVYLSSKGEEFDGGDFVFIDDDGKVNRTVEPRIGRMSAFTSGSENLHHVSKVIRGVRYAVTIAFTCDPKQAIGDPRPR